MRTATLVLALVAVCAASSALGQARVLSAPEQAQDQPPTPQAPAADDKQAPGEAQMPAPAPAQKQEQAPSQAQRGEDRGQPLAPERYSFNRVDGGLLRLDRTSGEVAFCRSVSSGWVCDSVPEERAALQKEIDQLRGEVAALQKEIAGLRAPPPPVPPQTVPPAPQADKNTNAPIKLPTAEDIARARAFVVDTWHRLVEMIEHWQKDLLRKS